LPGDRKPEQTPCRLRRRDNQQAGADAGTAAPARNEIQTFTRSR